MSITIDVGERFDKTYFLLRCLNGYLADEFAGETSVLSNIGPINDYYRKNWWERVEDNWKNKHCTPKDDRVRCDTLADPSCLVFLFEVFRATSKWFERERDLSAGDHCSLCAYIMYSLVGHCISYKKEAFVTETLDNDRLTELSLRVLMETDLSKRHAKFMDTYSEVADELTSWGTDEDSS